MRILLIHLGLITLFLFQLQGCSTSGSALNTDRPHIYLNTYQEVINATGEALKKAGMRVYEAEERDNDSYYVKYYKQKYDMGSQRPNPDGALMAEIIIDRVDDERTQVTIKEEEESRMVPAEYREKLGRDVLRQMRKLLVHESQSAKPLAKNGD